MIIRADSRSIPLAADSVQCVVTSPPYWGLRDYGTACWEGGDADCDHLETDDARDPAYCKQTSNAGTARLGYRDLCGKCGARRIDQQIGLEASPDEYVATMVAVFREVRRVLKDDGTVWLNLGDSYSSGGRDSYGTWKPDSKQATHTAIKSAPRLDAGLKPKDLCGMPWRIAFALQADGWWLRSDIIWHKPNPMPESVTDRPTRSHEYVFLLTKRANYYYDADAVREPQVDFARGNNPIEMRGHSGNSGGLISGTREAMKGVDSNGALRVYNPAGRNKRDVWTIPSEAFPESHFATFPQKLVEPCILAGSRIGDLVLDPFLGSGTVGEVCEALGRRWVGLELSAAYIEIAKRRTRQLGLFGGSHETVRSTL